MNYFGYKYREVMEMDFREYKYLLMSMFHAKAKNRLEDLEMLIYPHTSDSNRKLIHKKLHAQATPREERKKRAVTVDDLKGFGPSIEEIPGQFSTAPVVISCPPGISPSTTRTFLLKRLK